MKSQISSNAEVSPLAWVNPENIVIEDNVVIGPFCCIGSEGVTVEKQFLIIGKERFKKSEGGVIIKRGTVLTNYTSVNCALEKGSNTIIGENVISGTMNVIGHDSIIGDNTHIISHVVITGHVNIGKSCFIGPGAIIRNRITIGDNAEISMGAIVTQDVKEGQRVTGNFAIDHDKFILNLKKNVA